MRIIAFALAAILVVIFPISLREASNEPNKNRVERVILASEKEYLPSSSDSLNNVYILLDHESKLLTVLAEDVNLAALVEVISETLQLDVVLSEEVAELAGKKVNIDLKSVSFEFFVNSLFGEEKWELLQREDRKKGDYSMALCVGNNACNHIPGDVESVFDGDDMTYLSERVNLVGGDDFYIDDQAFLRGEFAFVEEHDKRAIVSNMVDSDENELFLHDVIVNDEDLSVKLTAVKALSKFKNSESLLLDLLYVEEETIVVSALYFLDKKINEDMKHEIYKRLFDTKSEAVREKLLGMSIAL